MSKTLVVSVFDEKTNIALLENGRLIEIHDEIEEKSFSVGDIYLGKVKKIAPNLNAAFVNIGYGKDAFLHYHDLGPQYRSLQKFTNAVTNHKHNTSKLKNFEIEPDIEKSGTIDKVLAPGQDVLIQITKEPISTKGPRISSEISLAGRYMVLSPFGNRVSVSKSIEDSQEKTRLRTLIESIKPEGFSIITRTAAEGKSVAELHADLSYLLTKWNQCFLNLQKNKSPMRVLVEMEKAQSILRDNFNDEFKEIICDDKDLANEMREYVKIIAPEKENMVKFYDSHTPLYENYNIDKQIKSSFGKHVTIPSSNGGYLVIEHTEALHVIDINSGTSNSKKENQEESAFQLNMKAATEIARQLRLRDMGGIIVIDFIDLRNNEHKKALYEHLREEMNKEKTKHKILPPSKFGLIQVTRQRVRPEKQINTTEEIPQVDVYEAPVKIVESIEIQLSNLLQQHKGKLFVHLHPFVEAYLTKGILSTLLKWNLKYKNRIRLIPRNSFNYLEIRILDKDKKEIFALNS